MTALALVPEDRRLDAGCAISFDGSAAIGWTATAVSAVGMSSIASRLGGAAAIGDALWALVPVGGGWAIGAWAWDGTARAAPQLVPELGAAVELIAGVGAAIVHGKTSCEARLHDDRWTFSPLAARERRVPVAARTWIERRNARLILHCPGGERELATSSAGGTIVGGGALSASFAAVELAGPSDRRLAIVDLRTGDLIRTMRVDEDSRITTVAATGHVLILRDGRVAIIDAVRNRCVAERALDAIALAVSGNGARVAALGERLRVLGYDELALGPPQIAVIAAAPGPEPEPAPAPEPEPAPEPPEPAPERQAARALALPTAELRGLAPRRDVPALDAAERDAYLASVFEVVAAMCSRALARSWDSGRLGGIRGELPYADEMTAILDGRAGRASERLAAAIERERAAWDQFSAWNRPGAPHVELAAELGLSSLATAIALIVAAPTLWGELARVYGVLVNDPARPSCDELLVAQILGAGTRTRRELARELDDGAPLVRHGVVTRAAGRRPFAELTVPAPAVTRLAGERDDETTRFSLIEVRAADRDLDTLRVPRATVIELLDALAAPRDGAPVRVVLRGRSGAGRRSLAATLAARAGRRLAVIELVAAAPDAVIAALHGALRDARLYGWVPCVSGLELAGDEPAIVAQVRRVIAEHPGPLFVRAGRETIAPLEPGFLDAELPPPPSSERIDAWQDALARAGLATGPASSLAARYDVGPGVMARAAAAVARRGAGGAIEHRLDQALRQHRAERIAAVARRVDRLPSWGDLVLPDDVLATVRELCDRIRHRGAVAEHWGWDRLATTGRGVTALFQGGPGTGKTMLAGAIARELGYDLYQVDLSRVLSKWIGETEKNLATVFDAAEDGEMIVLFDEADALFARRTEVKSSNDRHANAEVNYLLQRLDRFEGVAILTSNFGTAIDDAFKRRIGTRLTVPFPDEALRVRLWRSHLPPPPLADAHLPLAELAERYAMSGAYIRNAALRAAHLAAGRRTTISAALLEDAIRAEYRDADRISCGGPLS